MCLLVLLYIILFALLIYRDNKDDYIGILTNHTTAPTTPTAPTAPTTPSTTPATPSTTQVIITYNLPDITGNMM